MTSFREYVNEAFKNVLINLGDDYYVTKLGYDNKHIWTYTLHQGSKKPKRIQHQKDWGPVLTDKSKNIKDLKVTTMLIKTYNNNFGFDSK